MSMSIEEMIESFKAQQKEVVDEVRNLENQINAKKEDYFKLQGAIEALTIQLQPSENAGPADQSGQSPSQPPGYEMPENLTDIPGIDVIPVAPEG